MLIDFYFSIKRDESESVRSTSERLVDLSIVTTTKLDAIVDGEIQKEFGGKLKRGSGRYWKLEAMDEGFCREM